MNTLTNNSIKKHRRINWVYRLLSFCPAIVMMGVIYYFSSLNATNSSEESSRVVNAIIWMLKKLSIIDLNSVETAQLAQRLTYPVRKLAHMTEYAVLAMTLFWGFHNLVTKRCYTISWIVTILYAITDEIHQLYVPGRAGKATDVLIDSIGACIGLICICFVLKLLLKSPNPPVGSKESIKKKE